MNIKRSAISAVVVLSVTALGACGSDDSKNDNPTPTNGSVGVTTPVSPSGSNSTPIGGSTGSSVVGTTG